MQHRRVMPNGINWPIQILDRPPAMNKVTDLELFAIFKQPVASFSTIAWDMEPSRNESEIPHTWITYSPMFMFRFGDHVESAIRLALAHAAGKIEIVKIGTERESLCGFAYEMDSDKLWSSLEPIAVVELTELLNPIDSVSRQPMNAGKVCTVRNIHGNLVGLLVWFQIGSSIAFVIGPYDEQVVLFGDNVEIAFLNAVEHSKSGLIEVSTFDYLGHSIPVTPILKTWDWFNPRGMDSKDRLTLRPST